MAKNADPGQINGSPADRTDRTGGTKVEMLLFRDAPVGVQHLSEQRGFQPEPYPWWDGCLLLRLPVADAIRGLRACLGETGGLLADRLKGLRGSPVVWRLYFSSWRVDAHALRDHRTVFTYWTGYDCTPDDQPGYEAAGAEPCPTTIWLLGPHGERLPLTGPTGAEATAAADIVRAVVANRQLDYPDRLIQENLADMLRREVSRPRVIAEAVRALRQLRAGDARVMAALKEDALIPVRRQVEELLQMGSGSTPSSASPPPGNQPTPAPAAKRRRRR